MSRVNFVKRNFTDGDDDAVLLEYLHNVIAIITLNRAKNRNSMTPDVLLGINRCIQEVKANKDVDALLLLEKALRFLLGLILNPKVLL